ncbi:MAG TPA: putative peptidoglycan glycosyltransferase FtsW [Bacteroidota bacterium]|nr:putative peptidoglycan glycosyltransferase FtsW [Bacteroidota bacterium]
MDLSSRNHVDVPMLLAVIALMFMSLGIVYSASASWALEKYGESERMLVSHAVKVFVGIGMLFIGMSIDYHKIKRFSKIAVIGAIVLLLVTLAMGGEAKGATRWLRISSMGFQPSEFAKYALLFHLCTLIAVKGEMVRDFKRGFLPMVFWIGAITVLVMKQPNFSMGTIIFALSMMLLFIGRVKVTHIVILFLAILPPLVIYMLSADYRRARIITFMHGGTTASGHNYQLLQGMLGFGNGGIFGVGPGESKQRDLFLPESYGDFVFSIVGEEYGLVGTIVVMGLFLFIMVRGFRIARRAMDDFGRNLAITVTCAITLYALVNASVTLGMVPTTGLPMPFVSYGGSSMVFSAFAIGILLNVSSQTDLFPRATTQIPVVGEVNADEPALGKVY